MKRHTQRRVVPTVAGAQTPKMARRIPVAAKPLSKSWEWLDRLVGQLDQDFPHAVGEPPQQAERPQLDELFR